jgi:ubiquinone biosynthesis protein
MGVGSKYKHLQRYREIVRVMTRHGFGSLMDQVGRNRYLSFPHRLLRPKVSAESTQSAPLHLRLAIEELGPTFVKVGHILSTRPDLLPVAYISELAKLQDTVPPAPWEQVRELLEDELQKPLSEVFLSFNGEPSAAASLGQVYQAKLLDGQEVVVKVQRPNIERTIETDLEILVDMARAVQQHTALGDYQDLVEIAEDFAATMWAELDYRQEGRNADRLRRNFAAETALYVPNVHWDYTTKRVLTLERISGIKIDDIEAIDAAGIDRHQIAANSARIIVKEVLEDGFFHGDPHPGNFFALEDGRIGAIDFGLVGYLDEEARRELVRMFIAAVQMDTEAIVDQLIDMRAVPRTVDRRRLGRDLHRLLAKYQGAPLAQLRIQEVMRDVQPVAFRYHLRLPPEYWLLAKTLVMMEGMGLRLAPDFDMFAISEPYVQRFARRMVSPRAWGKTLLQGAGGWSDLFLTLPRQLSRFLDQLEDGELQMTMNVGDVRDLLATVDSAVNRIATTILMASLIIGMVMLIRTFIEHQQSTWLVAPLLAGWIFVSCLGVSFILSAWRGWKR